MRSRIGICFCALLCLSAIEASAQAKTKARPKSGLTAKAADEKLKFKGIFEPVSYPEDIKLHDVFFVSETEGWVSGDGGTILHTTDAGATWTPQMGGDPQSQEGGISDLQFLDARHGWAHQSGGKLLRTRDGENWEVVNPKWSGHYSRFVFTSLTNGIFIYGSEIHRSQDGGKSWKKVFDCAVRVQTEGMTQNVGCHFEELHFPNPRLGYALSREVGPGLFAVAKTTDGGGTWRVWTAEAEVGAKDGDALFFDENIGYATLYGTRLHKTTDGGKTWAGVAASMGKQFKFADPEVGWSPYYSNGHHLSWTTDGGRRWLSRPVALPSATYINGFSLPSRQRGYVVGDHGLIFRYSVVPINSAAKGIEAPAMPAAGEPLQANLDRMRKSIDALETKLEAEAAEGAPSPADAPAEEETATTTASAEGGFEQDAAGDFQQDATELAGGFQQDIGGAPSEFIQDCCSAEIGQLQAGMGGFVQDLPTATKKYRSLNLIIAGLRMVSDLVSRGKSMRDAFRQLKTAPSADAAAAALQQLSMDLDGAGQMLTGGFDSPPPLPDVGFGVSGAQGNTFDPREESPGEPESPKAQAQPPEQKKEAVREKLKKKGIKIPF